MSLDNTPNNSMFVEELEATINNLQSAINILRNPDNIPRLNDNNIQNFQQISLNLLENLQGDKDNLFSVNNTEDDWLPSPPPVNPARKWWQGRRALVLFITIALVIIIVSWSIIRSNQFINTSNITDNSPSPSLEIPSQTELSNDTDINLSPAEKPLKNEQSLTEDVVISPQEEVNIVSDDEIISSQEDTNIITDDEVISEAEGAGKITPLTLEESLIANIRQSIENVTKKYGKTLILNIEANFSGSEIRLTLSKEWYNLSENQQKELAQNIIDKSIDLDLNKIYLFDIKNNIIARKAFIGNDAIILKSNDNTDFK
ncbi:MAG: hypothetical protein IGQ45_02695 [Cyanobacterium sp. T60_A2020_053]|nr:hypothetical protein [Cyanobacterium sp. T60_A2020_053]